MYPVGTKVAMPGVKDAVIVRQILKARGKKPPLYQIEYTIDNCPYGDTRRHQQPRFENEFKLA